MPLYRKAGILAAIAATLFAQPPEAGSAGASSAAQQKMAEALALARSHEFVAANEALKGVSVPSDRRQGVAFHRLRASIDAALQKPEQAAAEMQAALALLPADPDLLRATAIADLLWLDAQLKTPSRPGLAAALSDLRRLPLPDQQRAELRGQMGERLLAAKDLRDAVRDFSDASRFDPSNATAAAQLAAAQLQLGRAKDALTSALRAKALRDTAEIEALLGDVYEAAGDSLASVRSFTEAVRLTPDQERFRLRLGVELLQHQTYVPALSVLERAVIDFPQSARALTVLGLALFLSGKEQEGTTKLLRALKLDPAFAPALRYLRELSLTQTEPPADELVRVMCKHAAGNPGDGEANATCASLEARKLPEEAPAAEWAPIIERLASAAHHSPGSAVVRCQYGKVLDQTQDWPQARRELEACTKLDPNSVEAHFRLARVYRKLGLKELAQKEMALRAASDQRQAAINDARLKSLTMFLYSTNKPPEKLGP